METNPDLNGSHLKARINGSEEESKAALRTLVEANQKLIAAAMESNKKLVDSIKDKLKNQSPDASITDSLKTNFRQSLSVSEDALDSIINAYSMQIKQNMEFNIRIVDAIRDVKSLDTGKLLDLIQDNFNKSHHLTIQNTREIMACYDRHVSFATRFNTKFAEAIKLQMDGILDLQRMSTSGFSDLALKFMKEHRKN